MANERGAEQVVEAGVWAKRYILASRALTESLLRTFDLGNTQWYVLTVLATEGPTTQRHLTTRLDVERATMSGVTGALVRKGLIAQVPNPADGRQKTLQITDAGRELWSTLPSHDVTAEIAFDGVSEEDLATVSRVLRDATHRLVEHKVTRRTT